MNENNPYHKGAGFYELNISMPVISTIRRQEARTIRELMSRYADPAARALEVGPGTGFYTLTLAQMFKEVVAVEDAAGMAQILQQRVTAAGADNVTVLNQDFFELPADGAFDVAAAIGVLDYIADPGAFVAKLCALARRAVIITVPQRGLWGAGFAAAGRARKIRVYRRDRAAVTGWAPGWRCEVCDVGLRSRLTKGLTLIAVFERS